MAANRFELLATWYLRFNGFFTTPDFTIHPDYRKQGGGTDADVLAVRFRHSAEYQKRFLFERDASLAPRANAEFLVCEVKAGACDLNDAWLDPAKGNIEYALRWMGFESNEEKLSAVAKAMYERGAWRSDDGSTAVRFIGFGLSTNERLKETLSEVQFILHLQVIAYLRRRFTTGCLQIARQNWEPAIREFAKHCEDRKVSDAALLAWAGGAALAPDLSSSFNDGGSRRCHREKDSSW